MTTYKPGTFIAFLDVESLERCFPPFPDGSDGIFEHAAPLTEFFQSLFGTGPDTPDSGFTDGSDGSFYPTRTRERKTPNENEDDVFHDNYYFVRRPDVGKKASDPSEPPKPVLCTSRSDLDRIAADLTGASRIALDIETCGPRKGDGLDPWEGDIRVDRAKLQAIAAEARQKWEPIFEFAAENGTNGTCPVLSPDEVADVIRDMNGTKSKPKADTIKKQMQRAETLGVLGKAERGKWSINPTGQTGHERDK